MFSGLSEIIGKAFINDGEITIEWKDKNIIGYYADCDNEYCYNNCCYYNDIVLHPGEVQKFKKKHPGSVETKIFMNYEKQCLKNKKTSNGSPCYFLKKEKCSIYEERPLSCRKYPVRTRKREDYVELSFSPSSCFLEKATINSPEELIRKAMILKEALIESILIMEKK